MKSLKNTALESFYWSLLDSFGAYFIRFGFTISIARILEPSDYGIMGMIIIFIGIGTLLSEGGFSMALIQKRDVTNVDYSTIFYFNLVVAIIVYLILYFSAHYIADFYNEQILINVIRVSGVTIVIGALSTIQVVLLSKELNFKKQTFISYIATFGSGITGVLFAYNGSGIWSLVYMTLSYSIIKTSGLWVTGTWIPSYVFDWLSFKTLFKFGSKIFVSGLSDLFFNKVYYPIIGRSYSSLELGFYTNATSFSDIIVKQTGIAFGRVAFPVFSSINNDIPRLSRTFTSLFYSISFLMSLITVISILSAHSFVLIFLTAKWLPAVVYMKLFLLEGFFFTLYLMCQQTITAIGLSGLVLKLEVVKKIMLFVGLLALFKFGIAALIIGQIISSLIAFLIATFYTRRQLNITLIPLFWELTKLFVIAFIIYLIDKFLIEHYFNSKYMLFSVKISFLPVLFAFFGFLLKSKGLYNCTMLLKEYIPNRLKQ